MTGPRLRRELRKLTDRREPVVKAGFDASVSDLCDSVRLSRLADAISRKDIEQAIEILGIERAAFGPLYQALRESYVEGGKTAAAHFTKALNREV